MMLGTRDRFAIQWELDKDPGGRLLLGRVCFWVGDVRIGDYDLGTALSDVFVNLQHLVGDCGHRVSQRFCGMASSEAFCLIQEGLFESSLSLSRISEEESWARFDVSLPNDVFDGYRMYLFDCSNDSRLLIGHRPPDREKYDFLQEQRLEKGEFDLVIGLFQTELGNEFTSLSRIEKD